MTDHWHGLLPGVWVRRNAPQLISRKAPTVWNADISPPAAGAARLGACAQTTCGTLRDVGRGGSSAQGVRSETQQQMTHSSHRPAVMLRYHGILHYFAISTPYQATAYCYPGGGGGGGQNGSPAPPSHHLYLTGSYGAGRGLLANFTFTGCVGVGGVTGQKTDCVPKTNFQFGAPLINFIFSLRKVFLMNVGPDECGGCPCAVLRTRP